MSFPGCVADRELEEAVLCFADSCVRFVYREAGDDRLLCSVPTRSLLAKQIFPGRKRWPRVQRHSHICRMSALHDSHWDTEICRRHDLAGDLGPSIAFSFVGSALPATKIDRMSFRTNQCCTLWFLGKSTICLSGLLSRVIRVMAMRRPLNQQDSTIRFCRHTW